MNRRCTGRKCTNACPVGVVVVEAWRGTLAPEESRLVELTFRPETRAVGDYTAVLQAFEAATGEAVEVPLSLEVTQGTDAEEETAEPEASALTVYPNPTNAGATVAYPLAAPAEVQVVAYDVLGRKVTVLHEGPLSPGEHALRFDAHGLPAGIYLVRARGLGFSTVQRITVVW